MTDSKIESAKKLLANGVPPREVAKGVRAGLVSLDSSLCVPLTCVIFRFLWRPLSQVPGHRRLVSVPGLFPGSELSHLSR